MRRKTFRLTAVLFAILALFAAAAPVVAAPNTDDWHWSNTYARWIDDACGTANEQFQVVIFDNQNYTGMSTKLCKAWNTFCLVPMSAEPGIFIGQCGSTANDMTSSFKIKEGAICVKAFDLAFYAVHTGWPKNLLGDYPQLNDMGWGNQFESMKEC